jgi:Nucleotidyl transferase of unknown function (DUF2204)
MVAAPLRAAAAVTLPADRAILSALVDLAAAFEEDGAPAMIIGGIAVIVRGVPRQTVDVDATVWAEGTSIERLSATLARHGIVGRIPDALEFARKRHVLLLRHAATGTPLEVSLAWLPFEREALDHATIEDVAGARVRVARPEDLIVMKAVAWRDRDRADIERLLVLHGPRMDLDRIRRLVREFSEALESPERIAEFEAIVRRATAD